MERFDLWPGAGERDNGEDKWFFGETDCLTAGKNGSLVVGLLDVLAIDLKCSGMFIV